MDRLTGQELLVHVKNQLAAGYTRGDAARTAGYLKGEKERTDMAAFERAFHEALGFDIPDTKLVRDRKPSGQVSVFKGGGTALSPAYMKAVGASYGDKFAVEISPDKNTITLRLMGPAEEEEEEEPEYDEADVELVAA